MKRADTSICHGILHGIYTMPKSLSSDLGEWPSVVTRLQGKRVEYIEYISPFVNTESLRCGLESTAMVCVDKEKCSRRLSHMHWHWRHPCLLIRIRSSFLSLLIRLLVHLLALSGSR